VKLTYTTRNGTPRTIAIDYLGKDADGATVIVPKNGKRRWVLAAPYLISREGRKPQIISTDARIEP